MVTTFQAQSSTVLDKAKEHHKLGEHDKAVNFYLQAAIESPNNNYDILSRMARCLSFQKKFKQALDIHLFLAAKYPQYHQGDGLYILKNGLRTKITKTNNYKLCENAIKILEKIALLINNKTKVNDVLSDLYWCLGDKKKAVRVKSLAANEFALRSKKELSDHSIEESDGSHVPDFMVIGPQKTGTTALYSYLVKHPNIYTAIEKEIFYFNTDLYNNGVDWYGSHFPNFQNKEYLTGEATAKYFNSPDAAYRIIKDLPRLKIIFILRDPAARAISDYYMKVRNGIEKRSLSTAISEEIAILNSHRDQDLSTIDNKTLSNQKRYVLSGVYYFFIKRYLDNLDQNQCLILESSDLKKNHDAVLERVYKFLKVDNYLADGNKQQVNVGKYSKKDREYQDTYQQLTEFYQPYNKLLSDLTTMEFPW